MEKELAKIRMSRRQYLQWEMKVDTCGGLERTRDFKEILAKLSGILTKRRRVEVLWHSE